MNANRGTNCHSTLHPENFAEEARWPSAPADFAETPACCARLMKMKPSREMDMNRRRPRRLPLRIALWGLTLGICGARAQTAPEPHARVTLISERGSLPPGGSIAIGLLFHLDKGWHIYWQNPGDSGEPPKVQWTLPTGFSVSTIRWPTPIRLGVSPIVDYGYEDQVLLMSNLSAPSGSQKVSTTDVTADVHYIVCREICIPGKSHLTLALPAAANSSAPFTESHALFAQTRAQLPRPLPSGWKISAESRGNQFIMSVHSQAPVRAVSFFPSEPDVIENAAPQPLASSQQGFRLTLEKSQQLVKLPATLKGVLAVNSGAAYLVSAPVTPESH
jgi:DsbC/DsbD-like thiol-disulfide interchange protein